MFVAVLEIPLWPSFVASASFYAVDADGLTRLKRGLLSNLAGICYASLTLVIVDGVLGGGHVALSLVVGAFMFLASLQYEYATARNDTEDSDGADENVAVGDDEEDSEEKEDNKKKEEESEEGEENSEEEEDDEEEDNEEEDDEENEDEEEDD